jgi:hypothetical protein
LLVGSGAVYEKLRVIAARLYRTVLVQNLQGEGL